MDEIKGIARVVVHPGKLDEWKRLTEQAMEIVRTRDPGTLQYEVFFNEDESEAIVFERYRDADAALAHFANIGHLMEALMATATVTGEVLGAWGGYYGRFGITTTRGWAQRRDVATAEQLVEHWSDVMDEASARVAPLDSLSSLTARPPPRS